MAIQAIRNKSLSKVTVATYRLQMLWSIIISIQWEIMEISMIVV